MASPGILQQISEVANAIIALALVVLIGLAALAAWRFRATYRKVNHVLDRLRDDIAPLVTRLSAIADDVNHMTKSIRRDIDGVNATIAAANERVQTAVALTEERLNEFNALLAVVQEEAEQVFVSTASAVRGVRGGAAAFRRRGMDFASDELDAAGESPSADEIEDRIEDQLESEEVYDGHDGNPEPAAETLSAAPRDERIERIERIERSEPRIRGARRRRI